MEYLIPLTLETFWRINQVTFFIIGGLVTWGITMLYYTRKMRKVKYE